MKSSDYSAQSSHITIKEEICIEIDPELIVEEAQFQSNESGMRETVASMDEMHNLANRPEQLIRPATFKETESRERTLSEDEKRERRKEQKRLNVQRARAKISQQAIEKRRNDDRLSYRRRKSKGLVKTIKYCSPEEQMHLRKIWRAKAIIARQNKRIK